MQDLPEFLYHYTSITGVEGILKNQKLWASLLHFLNDSEEWRYTLKLVQSQLRQKESERSEKSWPAFILKLADALDQYHNLNLCVFSMCKMSNQLSQWRSYCPSEGGYEIAFKSIELSNKLCAQGFMLDRCEYDLQRQKQKIDEIVSGVLNGPARSANQDFLQGNALNGLVEVAVHDLVQRLIPIAPFFKHPDFHEECEWRAAKLVDAKDPSMSYHLRGSIAVPHSNICLKIASGEPLIQSIKVGPNKHQDLAFQGLWCLASKYGVKAITRTDTPLRSF